jgi:hypothetical protein
MVDESHLGDYVPFSELRALDIPSELPITRHLIDGLAAAAESAAQMYTLSDLVPHVSATVGLLVETVISLEAELLAMRQSGNGRA